MPTEFPKITVLDHGYVQLIESWGSDERVIEAARMSTGKGFLGWGEGFVARCSDGRYFATGSATPLGNEAWHLVDEVRHATVFKTSQDAVEIAGQRTYTDFRAESVVGDEKLLRYLWENAHHTPFEMAGMTIEVQAPIFVFREWHRHRVPFGYNEMSSRYTPLPDVNYVPTVERLVMGSDGKNKQAGTVKGAAVLTRESAENFRAQLQNSYFHAEELYQKALAAGVPKELARIHLPVGRYSRMRATSNLRGWLGFLKLRMAPAAQYEIRMYANEVGNLISTSFPRTWELFAKKMV